MYHKDIKNDHAFKKAQKLADAFAEQEGRRPRIMMAAMGHNAQESNTKILATGFADVGFDVDIAPAHQTPQQATKQAVENDVHIFAVSLLGDEHKTLIPQVMKALKNYGREDIMVIVESNMAKKDDQYLFDLGVMTIFNPDSKISETALFVLELLIERDQA